MSIPSSTASLSIVPSIKFFHGWTFFIDSNMRARDVAITLVKLHGGKMSPSINAITTLITDAIAYSVQSDAALILHVSWLIACVEHGRLLPPIPYIITPSLLVSSNPSMTAMAANQDRLQLQLRHPHQNTSLAQISTYHSNPEPNPKPNLKNAKWPKEEVDWLKKRVSEMVRQGFRQPAMIKQLCIERPRRTDAAYRAKIYTDISTTIIYNGQAFTTEEDAMIASFIRKCERQGVKRGIAFEHLHRLHPNRTAKVCEFRFQLLERRRKRRY